MKILLDHSTPRQLAKYLVGHEVTTCARLAWNELENGELIAAAEAKGFDLMISSDQNIKYQQNLTTRKLALIVLGSNRRATIERFSSQIVTAVSVAGPSSYQFIELPVETRSPRSAAN